MNHELSTINYQPILKFTITLQNVGRRFNREWIFREVDKTFNSGRSYAILGPNGSGKSTLLQVLNGSLAPSAGILTYDYDGKKVDAENVFRYLSLAAPYLELIEELTLTEVIDFHFKFKPYKEGCDSAALIALLGMKASENKLIRYFSSGMKQRLKLALAFCADTPILMLDEPISNLDAHGIRWYLQLIEQFTADRLVIICSNQEQEYSFCHEQLDITDYKLSAAVTT